MEAEPANRRRARCVSNENKARRGVVGNAIPIALRTVRSVASPSSMCPLIRNCMAARR